ncbi:hypothetical protein F2Q68_00026559 [Brassica cretica]|uniref:Uncharacterized protein n=2 Tax=Brassica cretica TaxID=69181 RepID=A0A8S9IA95_BRACR|nr:hypothetical protein F2Q68_00026559 [Brassica cretica]KAF3577832.1 hypothetical protein DY000_02033009 [Brassica cretica]
MQHTDQYFNTKQCISRLEPLSVLESKAPPCTSTRLPPPVDYADVREPSHTLPPGTRRVKPSTTVFQTTAPFVSPPHQGVDPNQRRVPTSFTRRRHGENATDLKNGKLDLGVSSALNADLPYSHRSTVSPRFQNPH